MNYIKTVQDVIEYIEKNLSEDLSIETLSNLAYISPYHFSRIFKGLIGITIQEYIRRRRLSEGAKQLLNSNKNVLEIAIEFGFNSHEVFSRAFKQYFSYTPLQVRKIKPKLYLYRKIELYININLKNIKGGVSMEYKIVERDEIKLVGFTKRIVMPDNVIPKMWEEFNKRYVEVKDVINSGCYGVADNMDSEINNFDETVACEVSSFKEIPEGMITKIIPKQKYLVFTHKGILFTETGESKLEKTYEYIYGKLLPTLEFEVDKEFNFELYDERYKGNSPESEFDIYVPIK